MHIPDVSIPEDDLSDTEMRAVTWQITVGKGRTAVVDVATGCFSLHKDLAGHVTENPVLIFTLPKPLSYETAVLLGLRSSEGRVSVFSTTDVFREKTRIDGPGTYAILRLAAAGVATAVLRGHELDHEEPPETPYDMDQLPEPVSEEFDVTPEMLLEFDSQVESGTITLYEEISPDTSETKASVRRSLMEFLKSRVVRGDVLSE